MSDRQSAVILFSHGSVLPGAGVMLDGHVAAMRVLGRFATVEAGYLNYSDPPIEVAVEKCLRAGASQIVIVPYFLVAGKFVTVDLPARLEAVRQANPSVEFVLARAIEDAPLMLDIVRDLVGKCDAEHADSPHDGTRGVIMVLHGSPRSEANIPAIAIADRMSESSGFGHVGVGYLECNEPDIAGAIAQASAAGVRRLCVVPYFLHPGRHLRQDIPRILDGAQQDYPEMAINLCEAVGESSRLVEVLAARADEAVAGLR